MFAAVLDRTVGCSLNVMKLCHRHDRQCSTARFVPIQVNSAPLWCKFHGKLSGATCLLHAPGNYYFQHCLTNGFCLGQVFFRALRVYCVCSVKGRMNMLGGWGANVSAHGLVRQFSVDMIAHFRPAEEPFNFSVLRHSCMGRLFPAILCTLIGRTVQGQWNVVCIRRAKRLFFSNAVSCRVCPRLVASNFWNPFLDLM